MEYYTMTTNAGDQSIAKAIETGTTTTFKQIAVGDGNGAYYEPSKTQNALRREVWRGDAVVTRDANNSKRVTATVTIPATVGGFTIREAGIFDTGNVLMVVSKLPLSEKVAPESGASSDMVIRLYVEVSDANAVTVTVDPSAVMATKGDVDKAAAQSAVDLQAHKADMVAHVTAAERTAWNGKAEKSDIPSSLPANGGHASTADSATYANTAGSAPANGGNASTVGGYSFEDNNADPSSSLPAGRVHFTWS